jgi:K+-transporting ATPase A subunit
MDKGTKIIFIMLLIAVVFVCGLKVGENHVIRHQKIESTETGYLVDFDGEIYEYN